MEYCQASRDPVTVNQKALLVLYSLALVMISFVTSSRQFITTSWIVLR